MNQFVIGDYREHHPPKDVALVVADPVYDTPHVVDIVTMCSRRAVPAIIFCSVDDLYRLPGPPEQTCFWVKQPSTKNTVRRYSKFVEAITFWNGVRFYSPDTHWSTRTGVFTDSLVSNGIHPWKKPDSLIEKLLRNHYPGKGVVYDPCAGSGTVHDVCKRLRIPSFSVEINPKYMRGV